MSSHAKNRLNQLPQIGEAGDRRDSLPDRADRFHDLLDLASSSRRAVLDADIRIYCRWFDKMMASDPDMLSPRKWPAGGGHEAAEAADGNFPDAVVKMIDPDLTQARARAMSSLPRSTWRRCLGVSSST